MRRRRAKTQGRSGDEGGAHSGGSTASSGEVAERARFSPAWFAGTDLRILSQTPSEKSFYDRLGLAVFLLACGNGFALAVAASYMLHKSIGQLWWLGLGWTAILACGIEPLVLQLPSTRRRWLLIVLAPRVALSLFLAVQFGEPMMLAVNASAINNRMSIVQTHAIKAATKTATGAHATAIASDTSKIAELQRQASTLANRVEYFRFKSQCESNTPSCSYTHRAGCATYCIHFAHMEAIVRAQLTKLNPQGQIAGLRNDIAHQTAAQNKQIGARTTAIEGDNGLIAREEALAAIEKAHPVVGAEAWFLRLLFLTLDLLPLSVKVLRMLSVDSPYEAAAAAARRRDSVASTRSDERVRVDEALIAEQGRSDVDFGRIRISLENEQRIRDAEAASGVLHDTHRPAAPSSADTERLRVPALDLGDVLKRVTRHETWRIEVDARLARAGRIGAVLVASLALAVGTVALLGQTKVAGEWLVFASLAIVVSLATYTNWFTRAPRWALPPIFGTLLLGLALPVVLLALNL